MDITKRAQDAYGKRGYKIEDKDYFKKVHQYLQRNNFDTSKLNENLKNLQLVKTNKESYGYIGAHYNNEKNRIVYVDEKDLYHEAFHVTTKGIEITHDDGSKSATGLNEGITDLLTSKINKEAPTNYVIPMICAKTLEKIYGTKVFNSYFGGTFKQFISQFEDKDLIINLVEDLDEYIYLKSNLNEEIISNFYNIMEDLKELCKKIPKEELNEFLDIIKKDLKKEEIMTFVNLNNKKDFDIKKYLSDYYVR